MSKPFDNTLNTLIDGTAADWAAFLAGVVNIPPGPLTDYDSVRDGNLSNTAYADKVFRVEGPKPAYLHLELQAGSELGLPERMQLYNTTLKRRNCDRIERTHAASPAQLVSSVVIQAVRCTAMS